MTGRTGAHQGSEALALPGRPDVVDAICIGAGFAGLYACHRLTQEGFSVAGFEAAGDVGGTWRWNAYPGARCDIDSVYYSYSFSTELEQDWEWTERYATQPEILRYIEHVADRFDLRRHFTFDTRLERATWLEDERVWRVELDTGSVAHGRYLVSAVGVLSVMKAIDIPGASDFEGQVVATGNWDIEVSELAGKRVGIIGTGSSAVQCIPILADVAEHLTVFQRTPNFVLPARNAPMQDEYVRWVKEHYSELRRQARTSSLGIPHDPPTENALDVPEAERRRRYEAAYEVSGLVSVGSAFADLLLSREANETAAEFVRDKVREIVRDPHVSQSLLPRSHAFGAKRTCLGTDYYESFNRDNVTLVDLTQTPIDHIGAAGVYVRTNSETICHSFDALVFATGFDAVTGPLLRMNIATSSGKTLEHSWSSGPRTYLGLMTAGFPNLFMIAGAQSPTILSNVIVSIEQHVDWVTDLLCHARSSEVDVIDAEWEAQDAWVDEVEAEASSTLYGSTDSWYRGSNVPGKPQNFLGYVGGVGKYREICDDVARDGYRGFRLVTAGHGVTGTGSRSDLEEFVGDGDRAASRQVLGAATRERAQNP